MLEIDKCIKEALINHDTLATNMYRLIKAEILSYKTAKNAKPYDEAAEINLLRKMVKQREDSIEQYKNAQREDLMNKEVVERDFILKLLPKMPEVSEIKLYLFGLPYATFDPVTGIYPISKKDMGKVIKDLKLQFPTADGKIISEIVKSYVVNG